MYKPKASKYVFANDVGEGWRPIVKAAITKIIAAGGHITQVKEKFGRLRIYYVYGLNRRAKKTNATEDIKTIENVIYEAEKQAAVTCELCGKPGELVKFKSGWYRTVCEEHKENNVN